MLPSLPHLPQKHRYHVLFIERDLDEILASQRVMLERLGKPEVADPKSLRIAYQRLLRSSRDRLAGHPGMRSLRLSYRWLIANPETGAQLICDFLGRSLDTAAMADVVDPALHRQGRKLG